MTTTIQTMPKFRKGQQVRFVGGEGIIQNYHPEAGSWTYLIGWQWLQNPALAELGMKRLF